VGAAVWIGISLIYDEHNLHYVTHLSKHDRFTEARRGNEEEGGAASNLNQDTQQKKGGVTPPYIKQ
jgi:hypothetical protein